MCRSTRRETITRLRLQLVRIEESHPSYGRFAAAQVSPALFDFPAAAARASTGSALARAIVIAAPAGAMKMGSAIALALGKSAVLERSRAARTSAARMGHVHRPLT